MEKDNLKLYVDLMNKYDTYKSTEGTMIFNQDEKNLIIYMRKLATSNKEANKFLNSLTDMTPDERYIAVENYFNKQEGKSNIITLKEVKDYKDEIASKSKEDQNKLNYIINNYEKLKVKGIILDEVKYIDENDEIKEVNINDNIIPFRKELTPVEEELEDTTDFENDIFSSRSKSDITSRSEKNYEEMIESLNAKPVKEKPIQKVKQKSAYVNAIMLFFFTGVAGVILATVLMLLIRK